MITETETSESTERRTGRAAISLPATSAFMARVLRGPCPKHAAEVGEPCWTAPVGVCGQRIAQVRQLPDRLVKTRVRSPR